MTHNPTAVTAREDARKHNGQFGEQEHTAPELSLDAQDTPLELTGPPKKVVFLYNESAGSYDVHGFSGARKALGIPANEPDEVVEATIDLLKGGAEYQPFISEEPTYPLPGDYACLSTEQWGVPVGGITWNGTAESWEHDDDIVPAITVQASAVIDADDWGWAGNEIALNAAISDHMHDSLPNFSETNDVVNADGKVFIPVRGEFGYDSFEPQVIASEMNRLMAAANPWDKLSRIKERGIIISDEDMLAAQKINGRAVAYAAAHGRPISDAEFVAITQDFDLSTTIRHGYSTGPREGISGIKQSEKDLVVTALNVWTKGREGK